MSLVFQLGSPAGSAIVTMLVVPELKIITSVDNPRIKAVVKLRRSRQRKQSRLFIAEGVREVSRALEAHLRPTEWYACPQLLGQPVGAVVKQLPWHRGAGDATGFEVNEKVLKKIAYRDDPEGLIAVFEQPNFTLNQLTHLAKSDEAKDGIWLVGVGLAKPGNLGAMARTAKAAGCTGMIAADAVVDPFNPNAIRASTGAVFSLPIACAPADQVIDWLTTNSIRIAAATLSSESKPYTDINWKGAVAIVIGAEDTGLSDQWLDAAATGGATISIAMTDSEVDSLNASVAAGIVLFEAVRQRQ